MTQRQLVYTKQHQQAQTEHLSRASGKHFHMIPHAAQSPPWGGMSYKDSAMEEQNLMTKELLGQLTYILRI